MPSGGASMCQRSVSLIASNLQKVQLTQRTFAQADLHHNLRVVHDGKNAMTYLRREGIYTDLRSAPCPEVIVLDLPRPGLRGEDLLQSAGRRVTDGARLWSAQPPGQHTPYMRGWAAS